MKTPNNKNKWQERLKTADNLFIHDLLHNVGLSGGPSVRDLPWLALTGLGAVGVGSKIKELNERRKTKEIDDNENVDNFSHDMSKIREVIDNRLNPNPSTRNHPSVPGFQPNNLDSPKSKIFDYEVETKRFEDAENSRNHIFDISEHPRFNSNDQGKSQKGRPFDREEE